MEPGEARLSEALALVRLGAAAALAGSFAAAAPARAAPAAQMDIDTVIEGNQSLARFFSLAGVALLGLKMTAPGQRILQRVGLDVQDDYLIGLVIASLLLSNVETIVNFLGFGG
jgi:type IV secretory pathway VirB2 component (pilin)